MESVMETIAGTCPENRWFDKSFGMMFASSGDFGLRFEHSWGDGVAVMRFCDDVVNDAREDGLASLLLLSIVLLDLLYRELTFYFYST